MRKVVKTNGFWEMVGYITLALCVFGQITIGWMYIVAQIAYLTANSLGVIRDVALRLPRANLVRDIVFTAITLGLIVVKIFG
ncbi:MAG: hypothetical protein KBS59_03790 [Clostridiales bacterium]|nr:hypothetical protein [Clostridiales bacterium]